MGGGGEMKRVPESEKDKSMLLTYAWRQYKETLEMFFFK
jgi:hypothetical protein